MGSNFNRGSRKRKSAASKSAAKSSTKKRNPPLAKKGATPQKNEEAAPPGTKPPTRSDTEPARLKEELADVKQENNEMKKRLELLENNGSKKAKAQKHVVQQKKKNKGVWTELKSALVDKVYDEKKFLNNEADEYDLMHECLQYTEEWPRIQDLKPADLKAEVESYQDAYGSQLVAEMNTKRSTDQTKVRDKWLELRKKDKDPGLTAEQMLRVALRNPKYLLVLDEDAGDPEENAKNKQVNETNKKYRDRFQILMSEFVPCCVHTNGWAPDVQTKHIVSEYRDEDGKDMVPPAVEAMIIVFIENNQDKWEWASGVLKKYKNITTYKEYLKTREATTGQKATKEEMEPDTKYTSSKAGPNRYGGWNPEGKKRFKTIESWIKKAREGEKTQEIEERTRDDIKARLEEANKKPKPDVVSALLGDDEDDSDEEVAEAGYESCNSEDEVSNLKKHTWVAPGSKEVQAGEGGTTSNKQDAGGEKGQQPDATATKPQEEENGEEVDKPEEE